MSARLLSCFRPLPASVKVELSLIRIHSPIKALQAKGLGLDPGTAVIDRLAGRFRAGSLLQAHPETACSPHLPQVRPPKQCRQYYNGATFAAEVRRLNSSAAELMKQHNKSKLIVNGR